MCLKMEIMNNQYDIEIIEDYLGGRMEDNKKLSFEDEMLEDPTLLKTVREHKILLLALARLKEEEATIPTNKTSKIKPLRIILAVAATILLLAVACYPTLKSYCIYKANNLAFLGIEDAARGNNGGQTIWMKHFHDENYELAIELLELEKANLTEQEQLILGKSYLKTCQSEKAINLFSKSEKPVFIWHLALAQIQHKDFPEAKQTLKHIPEGDYFGKYAKRLSEDLNFWW